MHISFQLSTFQAYCDILLFQSNFTIFSEVCFLTLDNSYEYVHKLAFLPLIVFFLIHFFPQPTVRSAKMISCRKFMLLILRNQFRTTESQKRILVLIFMLKNKNLNNKLRNKTQAKNLITLDSKSSHQVTHGTQAITTYTPLIISS